MSRDHVTPAIDRAFRAHHQYTWAPNEDSLYALLTAIHSLDDKVKAAHGRVFLRIPEYVALKALRNYFHHEAELRNAIRVKRLPGVTLVSDLLYVCLVSTLDCAKAIQNTDKKYRDGTAQAFVEVVKDYGEVADINPCIFNCIVKVLECLSRLGLSGLSEEYEQFAECYDSDIEGGHSPYVTGTISTHAADVEEVRVLLRELYESA